MHDLKETPREAGTLTDPSGLAGALSIRLGALLDALPVTAQGPTALARALGVNRVPVSRLLGVLRREPGADMLASMPGPETLRAIVSAAGREGVAQALVGAALEAVDDFDALIRTFGTRSAFDASVSVREPEALDRFEQASRYQVFLGMSRVLGVEAEMWLSALIMTPSAGSETALDVTAVHGALGMRRLRPDVTVSFTYGAPHGAVGVPGGSSDLALDLSPYYTRTPAPLRSLDRGGNVVHEFCPEALGKDAVYDMLAGAHAPGHSRRYSDDRRSTRGVVVIPDIPVALMVVDLFVGEGVFPGLSPTVYLYNTVARGPADIEDPARLHDRQPPPAKLEPLGIGAGAGLGAISVDRLPGYGKMLTAVLGHVGRTTAGLRGWRLRVPYPLYGFQWVLAFDAPAPPDPSGPPVPGTPK